MLTLFGRNINHVYHAGLTLAQRAPVRSSRNGPVREIVEPVTTRYDRPCERVLFDSVRDANPFFHLFESLWMLAGRNDVAWISQYNKRIAQYSDDGTIFHGAYGPRWRHWWLQDEDGEYDMDQLEMLVTVLRDDPASRRAVLQMWEPSIDLGRQGKDFPCNLSAVFDTRGDRLNLTVFQRSGDLLWGTYGANVVQFSTLLEYIATRAGLAVGWYEHVTTNLHVYEETWRRHGYDREPFLTFRGDPYEVQRVRPYPLVGDGYSFDADLTEWLAGTETLVTRNPFFPFVATPLRSAWRAYKAGDWAQAYEAVAECEAADWRLAAQDWLERRQRPEVAREA